MTYFRDEAARMWQKREAEWEKERRARERLMKEVSLFVLFSHFLKIREVFLCSFHIVCRNTREFGL